MRLSRQEITSGNEGSDQTLISDEHENRLQVNIKQVAIIFPLKKKKQKKLFWRI